MHRINTSSVGWNQSEGVIFVEQTPAPLVLITSADTDIQTLAAAVSKLPPNFPAFRVANLLQLQQQITIDAYSEQVLESAQVIILRLLGGRAYWSYGLEVVQEIVQRNSTTLIVMPGDDALDPDLMSQSTISISIVNQVWRYFSEGGVENFVNALKFVTDNCLSTNFHPNPPRSVPRVGFYEWKLRREMAELDENYKLSISDVSSTSAKVGILFYRAHYLAGNIKVIDALCTALVQKNLHPVPVFVSSLREANVSEELQELFHPKDLEPISVLLNTTSFSLARLDTETPETELWEKLNVPVLQVILCASSVEQWESQMQGLTPRDIAMNVALPEVDGRIISRAVSFKSLQTRNLDLETDVVVYEPVSDRIEFVAQLAANWANLRHKPPQERRIALILANYPNTNGRLANGVGLDTPASCVEILQALKLAGYQVDNIPATGDELIQLLTDGVTNDPEGRDWKPVQQSLSWGEYQEYFATLPPVVQEGIIARWGLPGDGEIDTGYFASAIPIAGVQLGNVFVGVQPSRGYDIDPSLNYHAPDLPPTHHYLAFYHWLRQKHDSCFGADAVVHVGKHGNLEWLPGKSVALSSNCYSEVAFGPMPHLYPFIVNDPGEGSQAKRRAQAVIIDHLTPPMTRAELYGALQQVENLIDEYYEAESLDPSRLSTLGDRIRELVIKENLYRDLGIKEAQDIANFESSILNSLDGYLCELKEAQIRDGLHIFGQCPQDRQLRDLIVAIARIPNRYSIGFTRAIAQDWGLDFDPLTTNFSTHFTLPQSHTAPLHLEANLKSCRTIGDVVALLETQAATFVEEIITNTPPTHQYPEINRTLHWIASKLLPDLQQTELEITNLLRGLDGKYVPSAASGAPTRGRPEVLPTGKNFYAVDIRAIPTETAWDVGRKAAETLIETYTQEHGEYPKTLGLSLWGTATMRTGGDDIAEALALIGVQPVWDGAARRVVDFEILPLSYLGRPRVDVTLRISGFFRDAFPNLIDLFSQAVAAVAALDEPAEDNPLAATVRQDQMSWIQQGLPVETATERSLYRVFGSQPGAYGAGLQGLIASQNWQDDQDLARAYLNWSCYAYPGNQGTDKGIPVTSPEAFQQRLLQMQIVLHNQDNREHDLLDSDDYYQFQGGLTAAVRSLQGKNPHTYFGDNSTPAQPKVRQLSAEIARVYRSRVVNPKWIAGAMRHGYKGAFEMAATVDFLFAYDATANCVEDHMYQGIMEAYLQDSVVCGFIQQHNPWALRDIAERLLEAHQRHLWQDVSIETLENLRNLVHQAEAAIEEK
ncbi:cobaltochelatase, CobN subunit [Richelia sinica FACHB-800]|uniref:Cobaltochelatase, CobN subunit n=1 Tax=Richelia sinica FACHB-800 TaxID=1357546 RepID=A0A975TCJ1_9NOST|nr:cobaltochelatase subunit CobN [Richelia sinica]MBD2664834.1 cobaltochelatase subunit CobN [Richelia sinica FACHB-800]QXE25391.1 cobaltochelatase, CobN subunit [Richelia sinica FACHB-800]